MNTTVSSEAPLEMPRPLSYTRSLRTAPRNSISFITPLQMSQVATHSVSSPSFLHLRSRLTSFPSLAIEVIERGTHESSTAQRFARDPCVADPPGASPFAFLSLQWPSRKWGASTHLLCRGGSKNCTCSSVFHATLTTRCPSKTNSSDSSAAHYNPA